MLHETASARKVESPGCEKLEAQHMLASELAGSTAGNPELGKILEFIPQMIWSARPNGDHDYFSRSWYEFTGVPEGSTYGASWNDVFHPEDQERARDQWRLCLTTGEPYEIAYRLRHHTGEYHWVLGRAWPERDSSGKIVRWYGTCTDIHKQVLAEQKVAESEARVSKILDSVPSVVWSTRPDGCLDYANVQWEMFAGRPLAELLGWGWFDLVHPEDQSNVKSVWQAALASGQRYEATFRFLGHEVGYRWVRAIGTAALSDLGEITRWYGTCVDVHEQVLAEQALADSEALYRSVLETSTDCISILDPAGGFRLVNSPGLVAFEVDAGVDVRGVSWLDLWPAESRDAAKQALADVRSGSTARFTAYCPTARGTPKWWDVVLTGTYDEMGEVTGILSTARDITAQREVASQLKWASEHDALTELPNRRAFQARLQAATLNAMETGRKVGLLLLDLDHFKHINDTLGHAAGDQLLAAIAERLKSGVRTTDCVARLGGDEFAVILPELEDAEALVGAGQSILMRLQEPIRLNGLLMSAAASIGGAIFPDDAQSAHVLFNNADTALYAMKESGRGGTKMFHQHMRERAHAAANQLHLARIAITHELIVPHYQQKIDVSTGNIVGFEALLRWEHPHNGLQPPDTIAEAFKDYELASKIGELMQRAVFADVRNWLNLGCHFGSVAINAAPSEFLRDDYAERLIAQLREFDIPPHLIEVEVTEHVFLDRSSEYVARALRTLNQAGLRIALDDFGTGYSSLSHLRDFQVDVVKIDQSFVQKMTEEPDIAAIVSAVISLAKSLRIGVVAEGIETQQQLDFLKARQCATGQGFLFGKAILAEEVPDLLRPVPGGGLSRLSKVA